MKMVVTLLGNTMSQDIIKPTDPAFPNVPQHIQYCDRYWPHFKVLCYFGVLNKFYSICLYDVKRYKFHMVLIWQ